MREYSVVWNHWLKTISHEKEKKKYLNVVNNGNMLSDNFRYYMCEFVSKKLLKLDTVWAFIKIVCISDEE